MTLNIKIDNKIYLIQSSFVETNISGIRDSIIFVEHLNEYNTREEALSNWTCDPYDKDYKYGFLMNKSEDIKYDPLFPNHPLTQTRILIEHIIENN